jgi:hypothetical protein
MRQSNPRASGLQMIDQNPMYNARIGGGDMGAVVPPMLPRDNKRSY